MENQQQPTTTLCRAGCGFFGAAATEGLCSKCYKDHIQRKQDTARLSPTMAVPVPMASSCSGSSSSPSSATSDAPIVAVTAPSPVSASPPSALPSSSLEQAMTCSQAALSTETVTAQLESVEAILSSSSSSASLVDGSPAGSPASDASSGGPPTKKVNRCAQCKKRVGLTGFECRCGGLFCADHRYDTAHSCSFDYKTMEREQIAKNNPVVVSDKIQRI